MRGVECIHEMGVAHLDLTPENLLLAGNGLLKISDFGNSECVRLAWDKDVHTVIPPLDDQQHFDPWILCNVVRGIPRIADTLTASYLEVWSPSLIKANYSSLKMEHEPQMLQSYGTLHFVIF